MDGEIDPREYARFNNKNDVEGLDLNYVDRHKTAVWPTAIYYGEPYNSPYYMCDYYPRNSRTQYFYQIERDRHPDTMTNFVYGTCWNGYCNGNWSRGYNVSPICAAMTNENPCDMARPEDYSDNCSRVRSAPMKLIDKYRNRF